MTNPLVSSLRAYVRTVKDEQAAGLAFGPQLLALRPEQWEKKIAAHPEWLRFGTIHYLLRVAKDIAQTNTARGRAITMFVLAHVKQVPEPPHGGHLLAPLEGEALVAHGEVLLAGGDASGALQAALLAESLLARVVMGQIEIAHAKLLRAKACAALQRDADALDRIDECLQIYGDHGEALYYNRSLLVRAVLLCEMGQWAEAAHTLRTAGRVLSDMPREEKAGPEFREAIDRCRVLGLPAADNGLGAPC